MPRFRDQQRSRLYAWERDMATKAARAVEGELVRSKSLFVPDDELHDLASCQAYVDRVWKAERARYGQGRRQPPVVVRPSWGQRRAIAHAYHQISLPRTVRNRWMILHEVAHRLTPDDEPHGPRFLGVLIGLLHRHAGYDADELLASAQEARLRVKPQSLGPVLERSLSVRLLDVLPATDIDAALELGVHWRQVRGAAMQLIRQERARWFRGKLVRITTPEGV